jgi:hypothetical protein
MLKQLGLAMHNYHDAHGHFPPAVVYGKDGKPLLSWRVLILPYVERQDLYNQFHLDEPWNSPHNITLLDKIPAVYQPPPGKRSGMPPNHTVIHVFVGKGAAFEDRKALTFNDFTDGNAMTMLIVEAGRPVPWTKPEDLPYDPDGPLPDLPCLFKDSIRAAFADGSEHSIKAGIHPEVLRALITRNGNDDDIATSSTDW